MVWQQKPVMRVFGFRHRGSEMSRLTAEKKHASQGGGLRYNLRASDKTPLSMHWARGRSLGAQAASVE